MEDAIVIGNGSGLIDLIFAVLCVTLPAIGLWLAVRIFNRRERWAKRTAIGLVVVLLYPMSVGPACWVSSRMDAGASGVSVAYRPLTWGMSQGEQIAKAISWYSQLGSAQGWEWIESGVAGTATWDWQLRPTPVWGMW